MSLLMKTNLLQLIKKILQLNFGNYEKDYHPEQSGADNGHEHMDEN